MGLDNPLHILIVLVVVLLVFGAKRLPEIGQSLGEGIRGFTQGVAGHGPRPQELTAAEVAPATVPVEPVLDVHAHSS